MTSALNSPRGVSGLAGPFLAGVLGCLTRARTCRLCFSGSMKLDSASNLPGLDHGKLERLGRAGHGLGRSNVDLQLLELSLRRRGAEVVVEPLLVLHIIKRFFESGLIALGSAPDDEHETCTQNDRHRPFHDSFLPEGPVQAAWPGSPCCVLARSSGLSSNSGSFYLSIKRRAAPVETGRGERA